jgi:hypothetical protein
MPPSPLRRSARRCCSRRARARALARSAGALAAISLVVLTFASTAPLALPQARAAVVTSRTAPVQQRAQSSRGGTSLESAAAKAGDTGRAVAMSLIGLAFAVAATVLAFRRDFKEAAGVFAVGIVSVLLATPTGVSLLRDTVASLFGSG